MTEPHWFDRWHKTVIASRSRREAAQSLALLLPGLLLGGRKVTAKNGGKGGGKRAGQGDKGGGGGGNGGGKKGTGKKKPKKPVRCGQVECAATWPDDEVNRKACERKCGRCRIREKFCIIERDPNNPDKVATCCHKHQTCCPTSDGTSVCTNTRTDRTNCGSCGIACAKDEICLDGRGCKCAVPGSCGCPYAGYERCSGSCVHTQSDRNNCGSCSNVCASWERCEGGQCHGCTGAACCSQGGDLPDYCVVPTGGICTNTQRDFYHCGTCNNRCEQFERCVSGQCV